MNSQKKITNLDYLTELAKGNATFVKEMIEIFLTENPQEIQSIEDGINDKNFALIKTSVHKMKSTIPFVGLNRIIEDDLSEIERLCIEKTDLERIKSLFFNVKKVCLKAIKELNAS